MNTACQEKFSVKNQTEKPLIQDSEMIALFDKHFSNEYYMEWNNEFVSLAPKRGNKAHDQRTQIRVKDISNRLKDITEIDLKNGLSNLVHVVLTYPADCESWELFGKDVRHFLDSMRKDDYIGMTDYVITIEATKRGVAHAHILMTLKSPVKFVMSRRYNPQTNKSHKFGKLADFKLSNSIKDRWKYINTVEACYSEKATYYIFKYVTKGFSDVKNIYKRYKSGVDISDHDWKAMLGLYSLIKYNKRAFRVSRTYKKAAREVSQEPEVDLKAYKDAHCKLHDTMCEDCKEQCFFILVNKEAQCRKTKYEVTGFYSTKSIKEQLFKRLKDYEIVKSFEYENKGGWRNEIWRNPEIKDVELYYNKEKGDKKLCLKTA